MDYDESSQSDMEVSEDSDPQDSTWGTHKKEPSHTSHAHDSSKYPVHAPQVWEDRYKQLKLFKEVYGHCVVPARFPENRSLGYWVKHIRSYYNEGRLPEEWISKLNAVGFVWRVKRTRTPDNDRSKHDSVVEYSSEESDDFMAAEQLALLSDPVRSPPNNHFFAFLRE
jgi:hypothetical protein